MKSGREILERVVHGTDLTTEPLPKQPLVEVVGCQRVLIENHHGVSQYCCDEIHVKVRFGKIVVYGNGLELSQMTKERLVISGQISSVQLCKGG